LLGRLVKQLFATAQVNRLNELAFVVMISTSPAGQIDSEWLTVLEVADFTFLSISFNLLLLKWALE
jgi:hypothetical protein